MRNSFAALGKNRMTRKFGGTIYGVAQPYITGAFYIYFTNLPTAVLLNMFRKKIHGYTSGDDGLHI